MHHVYWELCTVWGLNCTSIHTVPACMNHVYTLHIHNYTIQQNLCQCLQASVEKHELLNWVIMTWVDTSENACIVQILLLFYAIYCAWEIIDTITRILWFSMPQCCNIHSFYFRCYPSNGAVGKSKLYILLQCGVLTLHCYIKARTYTRNHKIPQLITV